MAKKAAAQQNLTAVEETLPASVRSAGPTSVRTSSAEIKVQQERAAREAAAKAEAEAQEREAAQWRADLFAAPERLEALYQASEDFAAMLDAVRADQEQARESALAEAESLRTRLAALGISLEVLGSAPRVGTRATPKAKAKAKVTATPRVRASSSELDNLRNQIVAYVRTHPHKRGDEIQTGLGISKKDWQRVLKSLTDAGRLESKGNTKNTTYTAP
jgi:small-conductance mechanosensitive channel